MNMTAETERPAVKPWSLTRFPNYAEAAAVEVIDAHEISKADFMRIYVTKNRPCLIKNAVRHWPAFTKWTDSEYLRANSPNSPVVVRSAMVSEVIGWSGPQVKAALTEQADARHRDILFHDFLDELKVGEGPLVADSCGFTEGAAFEKMKDDVGGLPFMPVLSKARRYPSYRGFLYRDSYTDWHFHATDETFMTQVIGSKEILLLPPDDASWQGLRPVIENEGYLFNIDTERFPGTRALRPSRAVVEPGDALYIPALWWHAVESIGEDFGITVAATFGTPLHINGDLRYPIARKVARTYLFTPAAPLVLGAVVYSLAYRLLHGVARLVKR
ncbi:transcription factor [Pseudomonas frederiksbergensis]|uniref:Transcription factor n=2 Tax=Pseudomonas frederiksbergensis TaxID=104087 RepID=A0A423KFQ0_9PSED|nr:transcription factor [Pseudomonas frederiksbergensis]